MIKHMEEEPMSTWMVLNTQENGEKTSSTDSVLRPGPMVQNTKEITSMERSTGLVLSNGLMARCI